MLALRKILLLGQFLCKVDQWLFIAPTGRQSWALGLIQQQHMTNLCSSDHPNADAAMPGMLVITTVDAVGAISCNASLRTHNKPCHAFAYVHTLSR